MTPHRADGFDIASRYGAVAGRVASAAAALGVAALAVAVVAVAVFAVAAAVVAQFRAAVVAAAGVTDVYFEGEYPTMIMKSASDQPDAPKGKFLKSASYKEPVFYPVV